jgi:phosphatidylinositol glycan class V
LKYILITFKGLENTGLPHYEGIEAVVAIFIAHLAHLLAVLLLFKLTLEVFSGYTTKFAFSTAALHVISPAGVFLSAPYAETSCAMFAFAGCLAFAKSFAFGGQTTSTKHDSLLVLSGVLFGISTTFRSNGILNGLLLLEEAFGALWSLKNGVCISRTRRLLASGLGGLSVGVGFILPQYIAYSDFCMEQDVATLRPWCSKPLPSIYTFVQDYYW